MIFEQPHLKLFEIFHFALMAVLVMMVNMAIFHPVKMVQTQMINLIIVVMVIVMHLLVVLFLLVVERICKSIVHFVKKALN